MSKKRPTYDAVCRNRKASHRFEILEKIECGLVLHGAEVKSLRNRDVSIEEAYARVDGNELWLIGCHIAPYAFANAQNLEPLRRRKLLLHARELAKLRQRMDQKGFTVVPLAMYFNDRVIAKVSRGVARGKQLADKRRDLKKRDQQRDIDARRAWRRRTNAFPRRRPRREVGGHTTTARACDAT